MLDQVDNLGVDFVVGDDPGEFREMPGEPLLESHGEGIDVLVKRFDHSDGLDNWLVLSVDIMRNLNSGETMGKSKLGLLDSLIIDLLRELREVSSDSSEKLSDGSVQRTGISRFVGDARGDSGLADGKHEFLLLLFLQLWEVAGKEFR